MKKLKDILFEPDEYDGITWFDVLLASALTVLTTVGLITLIHIFC